MTRFWERVMLALVVCVPVPALAFSGLTVPLPSVVERVAAALVPFASAAPIEDGTTLASGRIVHSAKQEAQVVRSTSGATPAATVRVTRRTATPRPSAAAPRSVRPTIASPTSTSSGPSSTLGEGTTTAAAVGPPADSSTPAPAATAPSSTPEERPKQSETSPAEPTPVRPDPVDDVDVMPEPVPDVKPPKPVDLPVDEVVPDVKPTPDLPDLPDLPDPPTRDPRHVKPPKVHIGSGT